MKFQLIEEFLDEATFKNPNHLAKHYDEHVLKPDEEFDPNDPKFPYMTEKEYADRAEQLTLKKADKIADENELRTANSGVVGWLADDERWRNPREIKIDMNSDLHPGFIEIVGYVDSAEAGNNIMTYMLARRGKKYREFSRKIDELPENG